MALERWSRAVERITEQDVDKFAALSGDMNALHMDEAIAGKSRFDGTIVHGVLVEGVVSRVVAELANPGELAVFIDKETKYVAPVRPGDYVEVEAGVHMDNVDDSPVRTVDFSVRAGEPDDKTLVMKGQATVMFDYVGL